MDSVQPMSSLGLAGAHLYFSAKLNNKVESGSFGVWFMSGLIVFKKKPETNQVLKKPDN